MNIQQIMKQAQQMQKQVEKMQEELSAKVMEGSSGGGLVKVAINGKNEAKKVTIDPSLLSADEKEVLEDLLVAAFNDAKTKVDEDTGKEMQKITGGMNLPGGLKLPF